MLASMLCKDVRTCYSGSFRCNKDALSFDISFVMSVLASRSGTSTVLIDKIHINGSSRYRWFQSLVLLVVSRPNVHPKIFKFSKIKKIKKLFENYYILFWKSKIMHAFIFFLACCIWIFSKVGNSISTLNPIWENVIKGP